MGKVHKFYISKKEHIHESDQKALYDVVYAALLPCNSLHLKAFTDINIQYTYTSSTARGGGGSFETTKTIGEIGCCESRMSEQKHGPTD